MTPAMQEQFEEALAAIIGDAEQRELPGIIARLEQAKACAYIRLSILEAQPARWMTAKQVAERMGRSPAFVRALAREKRIGHTNDGDDYRFTEADVAEYERRHHINQHEPEPERGNVEDYRPRRKGGA